MRQPTSYQINRTSKLKITLRITSNSDRFFILLQPPSPSSPIVTITFNFRFTFFLSKQADRKTTTNRTIALSIAERISRTITIGRLPVGEGRVRNYEILGKLYSHRRNSRTIPRASPDCCCGWSNGGCRGRGTRRAATWADCCA